MDTNNTTNQKSGNCNVYGIVEDGVVTLPCSSCACDKGYDWNGKKCYGVNGISGDRESTLEELINVQVILVRPRFEGEELIYGLTPDEYILDNLIPDEGKTLYKEIVASLTN